VRAKGDSDHECDATPSRGISQTWGDSGEQHKYRLSLVLRKTDGEFVTNDGGGGGRCATRHRKTRVMYINRPSTSPLCTALAKKIGRFDFYTLSTLAPTTRLYYVIGIVYKQWHAAKRWSRTSLRSSRYIWMQAVSHVCKSQRSWVYHP
jgi:hypothetical protein